VFFIAHETTDSPAGKKNLSDGCCKSEELIRGFLSAFVGQCPEECPTQSAAEFKLDARSAAAAIADIFHGQSVQVQVSVNFNGKAIAFQRCFELRAQYVVAAAQKYRRLRARLSMDGDDGIRPLHELDTAGFIEIRAGQMKPPVAASRLCPFKQGQRQIIAGHCHCHFRRSRLDGAAMWRYDNRGRSFSFFNPNAEVNIFFL
jgi:hypothetical protein